MTPTIEQSVHFPATARELYDIYMDPKRHSAFTGGPVKISPKPGSKFDAFHGMLSGSTVAVIPGKLIVQRWRSTHFHAGDPDSILILYFIQAGKRGRIDLAHVNVPKQDHKGVTDGWKKYYWEPLRKYLKTRRK
jgi:activator of HSP90 ATPase